MASLDAFNTNAITFVVESSYRDWDTQFPAIVVCENKNMDRVQEVSDEIWGSDHDFTLEEVLSEMAYFKGESYHTVHECGGEDVVDNCIFGNYSLYARMVRSKCKDTLSNCFWNDVQFDCCQYFQPIDTEIGICYGINSEQTVVPSTKLNMVSNKYTGPGKLKINIITEAFIYTIGHDEVPKYV
jgi:amiloride-sensitive sodium channel